MVLKTKIIAQKYLQSKNKSLFTHKRSSYRSTKVRRPENQVLSGGGGGGGGGGAKSAFYFSITELIVQ